MEREYWSVGRGGGEELCPGCLQCDGVGAQDKGKNAPKVMAAFYVPSVTTQGVRDGYLVVASSIKGTPGSNVPSAGTSNYCDNQQ